ncbi:MAG TPA: acyl carrier protein [Syntrophaceae bacterium]|nr:acyl carrier protein [Syntrophaceae bacterium]
MNIEERIREIMVKLLNVKPGEITPHANLENDLGMDSTEIVEMTVALEKAFGIQIDDGEITKNQSIGDVVELVHHRVK